MATHAKTFDGQSEYISKSDGTRARWTHVEQYCIIFSKTPEEHIKRQQEVFQRLRAANLKISLTKCVFFQAKFQFLGHVIRKNVLGADPQKLKAVHNFPVQQNQTDVKSFSGIFFIL